MTYGQYNGVAPSLLLQQRRAIAKIVACDAQQGGQSIDMAMMLADMQTGSPIDPAFEAHTGPTLMWARAMWEKALPLPLAQTMVARAISKLHGRKRMWHRVTG